MILIAVFSEQNRPPEYYLGPRGFYAVSRMEVNSIRTELVPTVRITEH